MEQSFNKFLQIALIVDDVDKYVDRYESHGIGPWEKRDFVPGTIPDMTINGERGDFHIKGAFCQYCGVEFELIEPVSDGFFKDWLQKHGPGVHHFAFAPSEGYEKFMEKYTGQGKQTLVEVLNGERNRGFAYLDTFEDLGFYTEIHKGNPA